MGVVLVGCSWVCCNRFFKFVGKIRVGRAKGGNNRVTIA